MAPHDTNTEKEARRHKPALIAIVFSLAIAAVFLFFFLFQVAGNDDVAGDGDGNSAPEEAATEEVEETEVK